MDFEQWWKENDVEGCTKLRACELAFAAGQQAQREVDAQVCEKLGDGYEVNYESRQDGYSEFFYKCAAAIRRQG